jgi:hypothetical protein
MLIEGDSGSSGGGEGKSASPVSSGVSLPCMSRSGPSLPWGWQRVWFFVTRAKSNIQFTRHYSKPVDRFTGLRGDHVGKPKLPKSRKAFPVLLRKVRYYDSETSKELIFLTNNLEIPALTVAMLYKARWSIELFFRWIKGHLRIKHYYGTSPNAVKTQIWIAVSTYLIIAILRASSIRSNQGVFLFFLKA